MMGFLCIRTEARAAEDWSKGWEKLGSRHVRLGMEQDEIRLSHKGGIQQLVLEVRKASVNFKELKVHLLGGKVLDVPVRALIKDGEADPGD
jgi:hypothetical protein